MVRRFFLNILVEEGQIFSAMQNNKSNLSSMFDPMLYSINHLCSLQHANNDSAHQCKVGNHRMKAENYGIEKIKR